MRQHHFIVIAEKDDDGIVTFTLDDAQAFSSFNDGVVWDTNSEQWYLIDDRDDPHAKETYADDELFQQVLRKCLSYSKMVTTLVRMSNAVGKPTMSDDV
jgi:hypothetical protein